MSVLDLTPGQTVVGQPFPDPRCTHDRGGNGDWLVRVVTCDSDGTTFVTRHRLTGTSAEAQAHALHARLTA